RERRRARHDLDRSGWDEAENARDLRALGGTRRCDPRLGNRRGDTPPLEVAPRALDPDAAAVEREGPRGLGTPNEGGDALAADQIPYLVAPVEAVALPLGQVARIPLALEHDEPVAGAGARNVEESRMLGAIAVDLPRAMAFETGVAEDDAARRVDRAAHHAARLVERRHPVIGLQDAAQVGHDHDAELEAFRLMDRH